MKPRLACSRSPSTICSRTPRHIRKLRRKWTESLDAAKSPLRTCKNCLTLTLSCVKPYDSPQLHPLFQSALTQPRTTKTPSPLVMESMFLARTSHVLSCWARFSVIPRYTAQMQRNSSQSGCWMNISTSCLSTRGNPSETECEHVSVGHLPGRKRSSSSRCCCKTLTSRWMIRHTTSNLSRRLPSSPIISI